MLGCFSEILGEEEMLKGGSILPSLQYVLFHRRQDALRSHLGSCCCHPAGAAPPLSYVLHDDGLKSRGETKKAGLGSEMKTLSLVCASFPRGR